MRTRNQTSTTEAPEAAAATEVAEATAAVETVETTAAPEESAPSSDKKKKPEGTSTKKPKKRINGLDLTILKDEDGKTREEFKALQAEVENATYRLQIRQVIMFSEMGHSAEEIKQILGRGITLITIKYIMEYGKMVKVSTTN